MAYLGNVRPSYTHERDFVNCIDYHTYELQSKGLKLVTDYTFSSNVYNSSNYIADGLNGPAQGAGDNQRIGLKYTVLGFALRGYVEQEKDVSTTCNNMLELWFVLDTMPGTAIAATDLFEYNSFGRIMKPEYWSRYKVLRRLVIDQFDAQHNGTDFSSSYKHIDEWIPIVYETCMDGSFGYSFQNNRPYIYAFTASATPELTMRVNVNTFYTDP